jgi:lipopolysaccharide cholinephosphotransferase
MSLNYKNILNDIVKNNPDFHPITEDEKKALKKCLYEMSCDIDDRCRKNGIKLFLVGGTLLGAVRHGGFIPWDDDMDFALSRKDYKRLIAVFEKEFGDSYELRCPNSPYPNGNRFMQIFKKGTVLNTLGGENPLQPNSVYIDIFPYDYVPDNKIIRKFTGYKANFLMAVASFSMSYKYPDEVLDTYMKKHKDGKKLLGISTIVAKIFQYRTPEEWFNKVDSAITNDKETKNITSATGRKHYFGEIYPTDVFFPLKEMKFEEHFFYSPNNPEEYLKGLYGKNYMIPPAKESRESHFISELKI